MPYRVVPGSEGNQLNRARATRATMKIQTTSVRTRCRPTFDAAISTAAGMGLDG